MSRNAMAGEVVAPIDDEELTRLLEHFNEDQAREIRRSLADPRLTDETRQHLVQSLRKLDASFGGSWPLILRWPTLLSSVCSLPAWGIGFTVVGMVIGGIQAGAHGRGAGPASLAPAACAFATIGALVGLVVSWASATHKADEARLKFLTDELRTSLNPPRWDHWGSRGAEGGASESALARDPAVSPDTGTEEVIHTEDVEDTD